MKSCLNTAYMSHGICGQWDLICECDLYTASLACYQNCKDSEKAVKEKNETDEKCKLAEG